jgi:hypothetical protein
MNDYLAGVGVLPVAQAHGVDFLRRLTILVTVGRQMRLMMKKHQIMIMSLAFSQIRSTSGHLEARHHEVEIIHTQIFKGFAWRTLKVSHQARCQSRIAKMPYSECERYLLAYRWKWITFARWPSKPKTQPDR